MMKSLKFYTISLLCMLSFMCVNVNLANAKVMEEIDGVICWNGDVNYPFWSNGNRYGSVFDRSSAYVVENDNNRVLIRLISYDIDFESNSIVGDDIEKIIYSKMTGTIILQNRKLSYDTYIDREAISACRMVLADQNIY